MANIDRERFNQKIVQLVDGFAAQYKKRAAEVADKVYQLLQQGVDIDKAINQTLKEFNFLPKAWDDMANSLVEAACYGYGILPSAIVNSAPVKTKLLEESWAPDKMNLSTRLHGNSQEMRRNIVDSIKSSMKAQKSFVGMARELYDGYGYGKVINQGELPKYLEKLMELEKSARHAAQDTKIFKEFQYQLRVSKGQIERLATNNAPTKALRSAYQKVVDAAESMSNSALERAVRVAIEEKSRYHAERIARTEISRAWYDGYIAKHQEDDDVIGYQWLLSSRHSIFDQCDVAANADFGLGKGIYPKDKVPTIPRHPHCMCQLVPIYEGELPEGAKFHPSKAKKYIDSLTEGQKVELFGRDGLVAYKRGHDWQGLLRGWDGFGEPISRLSGKDFGLQIFVGNELKGNNQNGIIKLTMKDIEYKVRQKIITNGPQWKPHSLEKHLKKRKEVEHIPVNWSEDDYNEKILGILNNKETEIYVYYRSGFPQKYFVYGLPDWVVIIGENGIMETAFIIDRQKSYSEYLSEKDGYKKIGMVGDKR